jgi:hypothetical protein
MFFHTLRVHQNVINEMMTDLSSSGMNIEFMRYIKCVGPLINLNDMTTYS